MYFFGQVGVLCHIAVKLDNFPLSTIKEILNILKPSGFFTYHQAQY